MGNEEVLAILWLFVAISKVDQLILIIVLFPVVCMLLCSYICSHHVLLCH